MNDVLEEWVAKAEADFATASRELAVTGIRRKYQGMGGQLACVGGHCEGPFHGSIREWG
jgi:hypothetical protein